MTARAVRAGLYARVSTADRGQDTGLQLDELRQVAKQRGWSVVEEFVDEGVSGAKSGRPALDRLLADARAGRLDVVAVWRLDRLGRSLVHLLSVLDTLAIQGVGFASVRDAGIDTTTPTGRLLLQMLGAFAEFERALIQERVIAGVRRAQAAGKHCGRPRSLVPLDAAVALLRDGRGLREVATMLNVNRNVLRDRLRQARHWPIEAWVESPEQGTSERVG